MQIMSSGSRNSHYYSVSNMFYKLKIASNEHCVQGVVAVQYDSVLLSYTLLPMYNPNLL